MILEGDDKSNDIDVAALMASNADNIVRTTGAVLPEPEEPETEEPVVEEPDVEEPEPETGEVNSVFRAINTQTDTVNGAALTDGETLYVASLGIIAEPGMPVGSAVFYLDGNKVQTENVAPYALFGDSGGDFNPGDLSQGEHTLEVIFYENSGGRGDVLGSEDIRFEVSNGARDAPQDDGPDMPIVEPPLTEPPTEEEDMNNTTTPSGTADIDPNGLAAWADQILFHFDGNNNDIDDVAAIPVASVLAASAGIADKITFFHGNNITEDNNTSRLPKLDSAAAYAESFGIQTVDYQEDIDAATAQVVDILTSGQNVLAIEGGPMEAIYRALEQTPEQFHNNIKLLSHSGWNENRSETERPGIDEARTWDDIADDFPGVEQVEMAGQNNGVNNNAGFNNRNWADLDDATDDLLIELREMMLEADSKQNDPSDAGMLFFALTGIEEGTAQDAIAYISASGILDDTPDQPAANQDPITMADSVTVATDGSILLDVLANDVDPEGGELTLTDAFFEGFPGVELSVENNQVRITPDGADEERTLEFFYTVEDEDGGTGFERVALNITNDDAPEAPGLIAAINAGGDAFTSSNGIDYAADTLTRGRKREIGADIAGTDEDGLYTSARMKNDDFTYEIETGNGKFDLELNFAHMNGGKKDTTGERLVDIFVEDVLVFNDLDVESEAGKRAAFDLIGEVEVSDGALTVTIQSDGEKAVGLNGLSVWDASGDLDDTFAPGTIPDDFMFA